MTPPDNSSAASRLCSACGMCCNGAMFHTVQIKPGDSAKALAALGLKLKRKKGAHYILQPCPAHRDSQCSIYAARPERCRLFECRQLKGVASGESTEAMALEKIREAKRRVEEVNALLQQAGKTDAKRPLSKRCEKVVAEPAEAEALEVRERLAQEMLELEAMLDAEFRLTPIGAPLWLRNHFSQQAQPLAGHLHSNTLP